MNTNRMFLTLGFLALVGLIGFQQKRITHIKDERDRQITNNDALLSEQRQWQIDSATMATDVKSLRFTLDEMELYRAGDLEKIRDMGVKIKNLEAAAKHDIVIEAPIKAPVTDTVVIREKEIIPLKAIKVKTPHIAIDAVIERDSLIGSIYLPVTLRQAVWVEYKRRWIFWKRVVAVHQTITSDNPHIKINYSEYIRIQQ